MPGLIPACARIAYTLAKPQWKVGNKTADDIGIPLFRHQRLL
ncbi:hypothetical protein [Erwinia amylovora]|nr:hypothetical protein [Erwinia amylovora]